MKRLILVLPLFLVGCIEASPRQDNPIQAKQKNVLNCVERLMAQDIGSTEAFEICRQVYKLHKIGE